MAATVPVVHDLPMRLVPRQLRRSDFPSSVPYYGGRLTPWVIAGIDERAQAPGPQPAQDPGPQRAAALAAVQTLLDLTLLTEQEHRDIAGRIEERY